MREAFVREAFRARGFSCVAIVARMAFSAAAWLSAREAFRVRVSIVARMAFSAAHGP